MDLADVSGVLVGAIGIATGAVAIVKQRAQARHDAYDDARKDLDECKERGDVLEGKVATLESTADALTSGLAKCESEHRETRRAQDLAMNEARSRGKLIDGLRVEMDELRRSLSSEGE